ncbi:MAG TPA: YdcF family protein [Stellaceae bacterium]|nr:YdcF family protein [Stellaceae bacterium]
MRRRIDSSPAPEAARATRSRSCCAALRRAFLALAAVVTLGGAAAWFAHTWLLRTAAELWVVSDPAGPADAAAVLGGGLEDRPFAAAAYYRSGLVKKILVSNAYESLPQQLGLIPSEAQANTAVLVKLGVPADAVATFGSNLRNTHEEVVALREWAERTEAHSLIVPTEIFPARRVKWTFRHIFPADFKVRVVAVGPPRYSAEDWWEDDAGLVAFQNEIVKYAYYRLKY